MVVEFGADARIELFKFIGLKDEPSNLVHVKGDLVEKEGLPGKLLGNVLQEVITCY